MGAPILLFYWFLYQPSIAVGDGKAPIPAESARGDLHAGRTLAAFVFAGIHQAHDTLHRFAIKTHGYDLLEAAVFFGVGAQDGIEHLVWWQGIGVFLAGTQFCGGRLFDDGWRYDGSVSQRVAIAGEFGDQGLQDIFD